MFFKKSRDSIQFHGRWPKHTSRVLYREAAHTQELILTNEWDATAVEAIVSAAYVTRRILGEPEPNSSDPSQLFFW